MRPAAGGQPCDGSLLLSWTAPSTGWGRQSGVKNLAGPGKLVVPTADVSQWLLESSGRLPTGKQWVIKLCAKIKVGNPFTHEKEGKAA